MDGGTQRLGLCWANGPGGLARQKPSRAVLAVIPPVNLGWEADPLSCQASLTNSQKDPKMLASYSACLFWASAPPCCTWLLAYYFY